MSFAGFLDGMSDLVAQVRKGIKPGAMPAVMGRAQDEARRRGHSRIGTEHLLLGLLTSEDGESARLLTALGIDPAQVRRELEASLEPGSTTTPPEQPGPTPGFKQALMTGMFEARSLKQVPEQPAHFLLGVLRDADDKAAQRLYRLGATFENVRALIQSERRDARPLVTLDDRSEKVLYEQIVEQIREAIATGRLAAGERLPTVRQLADQLGIAPGTVARAYATLEEAGVVLTDGARGTFVAPSRRGEGTAEPSPTAVRDLLRTAAVAAFHAGASAADVRAALEQAMKGIFTSPGDSSPGPAPGTPSDRPPPR